ncbi:hypothetical protein ACWFRJ_42460 [Streptomyces sp. NPDC055239]
MRLARRGKWSSRVLDAGEDLGGAAEGENTEVAAATSNRPAVFGSAHDLYD